VTFRSRVITATGRRAAIAVILACFASSDDAQFVDSLRDESLHAEATPSGGGHENKLRSVPRAPDGQTVLLRRARRYFVENSRRRDDPGRRQGQDQPVYRTVAIGGTTTELIVPIVPIQSDVRGKKRWRETTSR